MTTNSRRVMLTQSTHTTSRGCRCRRQPTINNRVLQTQLNHQLHISLPEAHVSTCTHPLRPLIRYDATTCCARAPLAESWGRIGGMSYIHEYIHTYTRKIPRPPIPVTGEHPIYLLTIQLEHSPRPCNYHVNHGGSRMQCTVLTHRCMRD